MKKQNALHKGGLIAMAAFFMIHALYGQQNWQQEVNYQIRVSLDDQAHRLRGELSFVYYNHSPQGLQEMYIHLWPNAYSHPKTALGRQLLEQNGKTLPVNEGFIDSLAFSANGTTLGYEYWNGHRDVIRIQLPRALEPGDSVVIHTPFRVGLPDAMYSRLGRNGQSYMITQWYPKPAVYDEKGWHPMPYLNQGEFYSEFGTFDVEISLPANYVVGASGVLLTESEQEFLAAKCREPIPNSDYYDVPPSDTLIKTLHYRQARIHDFAWFAAKDFVVRSDTALMSGGRQVICYSMATVYNAADWKHAAAWTRRGIEYYSERVGEYPYGYCTVVDGSISAGAGMEYPMITVIEGGASERTIVHEVGHNWFYGILGSDEREHPWLDEGLNSYYEDACFRELQENGRYKGEGSNNRLLDIVSRNESSDITYWRIMAGNNLQQAPDLPAVAYGSMNYGQEVYAHTSDLFAYLELYLGREVFDEAMQAYYRKFAFKHPYPSDLQDVLEQSSGKELDWFFQGLMHKRELPDLSLKVLGRNVLLLENNYTHALPAEITLLKSNVVIRRIPVEPFLGKKELQVDLSGADRAELNREGYLHEKNYSNNLVRRVGGVFRNTLPATGVYPFIAVPFRSKERIGMAPVYAWNNYNKSMIGLAVHNKTLFARRHEFLVLPMLSFNPVGFAAIGDYRYRFLPDRSRVAFMDLGLNYRRFAWDFTEKALNYNRLELRAEGEFKRRRPAVPQRSGMQLRYMAINKEAGGVYNYLGIGDLNYEIAEAAYWYEHFNRRYPFYLRTALEYKHDFYRLNGRKPTSIKLWAEAIQKINYVKNRKGLEIRAFAGVFLLHSNTLVNNNLQLNGWNGSNDYLLDYLYFGRSDVRGFTAQQFVEREGNFKINAPGAQSSRFLTTLNVKVDFPLRWVPVGIYADLGLNTVKVTNVNTGQVSTPWNLFYNAGLYINLLPNGACSIYLPIPAATSQNFMFANNNFKDPYLNYVRFSLNLMKLNPFKFREWVRELK